MSAAAKFYLLTQVTRGGGPVNESVPTIDADPVIGTAMSATAGTWDDTYTLTYQWQRSADGSTGWTNISGATAIDWTPVDAQFGYFLRVAETADGAVTAYSAASAATVAEVPAATGADVLTNGDFSAWTADNPDGWTIVGTEGASYVTEVASGGGAGTGAARLVQDTSQISLRQNGVLSVGAWYEWYSNISAWSGTGNGHWHDTSQNIIVFSEAAQRRGVARATQANASISPRIGTWDATFDEVSVRPVDTNAQLTAPSADMQIDCFYTLPGSPATGSAVFLFTRVSDYAAGNYWLALLSYTGSAWNINLYSVATHTRTSRIAATGIGATNGIRVSMNADAIELFTTANSGGSWTSRGTVTNSTYQTATGVNAYRTSDVTAGELRFVNLNP